MTLALLPLNRLGCRPRGLACRSLGNSPFEKEQAALQMTNYRSLGLLEKSQPGSWQPASPLNGFLFEMRSYLSRWEEVKVNKCPFKLLAMMVSRGPGVRCV